MKTMEILIKWFTIILFNTFSLIEGKRFNILVFGGNGFIGAETVERLLSNDHMVILINRGNWYWDSEERIKPFVKHVGCDRMSYLADCVQLQSFLSESGESLYFDFIIDFSAYYPFQITDALETFQDRIGKYIYISSDSVYEVCEKNHDGYTVETDSIRPTEEIIRMSLNEKDGYGDQKLACEEILIKSEVPYLILRLPDVIGSRDSTLRFWIYQIWIKLSNYLTQPITIPKRLFYKPLSFVYVNDVSDIILRSLSLNDTVYNQAYNLAFSEQKTLYQLLSQIRTILSKEHTSILLDEREDYMYLFPSVTLGPVSIEKAKQNLDWTPTLFETAIKETVKFYEDAITNDLFMKEANKVMEKIKLYIATQNPSEVYHGIHKEYGISLYHIKEDL